MSKKEILVFIILKFKLLKIMILKHTKLFFLLQDLFLIYAYISEGQI